jgi:hypothetical protein
VPVAQARGHSQRSAPVSARCCRGGCKKLVSYFGEGAHNHDRRQAFIAAAANNVCGAFDRFRIFDGGPAELHDD